MYGGGQHKCVCSSKRGVSSDGAGRGLGHSIGGQHGPVEGHRGPGSGVSECEVFQQEVMLVQPMCWGHQDSQRPRHGGRCMGGAWCRQCRGCAWGRLWEGQEWQREHRGCMWHQVFKGCM